MDHALRGPVLLIGYSYVQAIENAWRRRDAAGRAPFAMQTVRYSGLFDRMMIGEDADLRLNPEVERIIGEAIEAADPKLIVAAYWGNHHFPLSTVNSPRRFDFKLPDDEAFDAGAELAPFDLVAAYLGWLFSDAQAMIAATRTRSSAPLALITAPPPLHDFDDLPLRTGDRVLDEEIRRHGVAPPALRRKVWRVCETIHAALAAQGGAFLLPTPPGVADARGFRRREFYSQDWIHANEAWGDLVLEQIDEALNAASRAEGLA